MHFEQWRTGENLCCVNGLTIRSDFLSEGYWCLRCVSGEGSVNGLIIRSDFSSEGYWCFRCVSRESGGVGVGIVASLSFLVEET